MHDELVVELEPVGTETARGTMFGHVGAGLAEISAAESVEQVAASLARAIRRVNGYDRVSIDRLEANWDGTLIAEGRDPAADALLGLRFPAGDIPRQARRLYEVEPVRAIPDVGAAAARIVSEPDSNGPLDCSHAALRAVSPVHLEYMANMGVEASMSVSLLRPDGRLWGLAACHHGVSWATDERVRTGCRLLGETAAVRIAAMERAARECLEARASVLERDLVLGIADAATLEEALLERSATLLDLFGASAGALVRRADVRAFGRERARPDEAWIARLADLVRSFPETWVTASVRHDLPEARPVPSQAAGLLVVRLGRPVDEGPVAPSGDAWHLLLFRPESRLEIDWAGDPTRRVREDDPSVRISPRRSFAAWRETVAEVADPWPRDTEVVADRLRRGLGDVLAETSRRRAARLESEVRQRTVELRARVDAMRDFTDLASHELESPLVAMEGLVGLARRHHDGGGAEHLARDFDLLTDAVGTMRASVSGLLAICTVGQDGLRRVRCPLEAVVTRAIAAVEHGATERRIEFVRGELPDVIADRRLLEQVLVNLLSNAVKYGRDDGRVTISAQRVTAGTPGWVIEVSGDGVGFEPRFADRIFLPFQRLDQPDGVERHGSGLGPAIVRRIVELHGGHVTAHSPGPGRGAFVRVLLPDAEPDEPGAGSAPPASA